MNYIAVDVETGGLSPRDNPLLSIALVKLDENIQPIDQLELYILPVNNKVITDEAKAINGYSEEAWKKNKAMPIAQALRAIKSWDVGGYTPLAHKASFDKAFFFEAEDHSWIKTGLPQEWVCSKEKFEKLNKLMNLGFKDSSLNTLARASGHWKPDFERGIHSALTDALACAAGFKWLTELEAKSKPVNLVFQVQQEGHYSIPVYCHNCGFIGTEYVPHGKEFNGRNICSNCKTENLIKTITVAA